MGGHARADGAGTRDGKEPRTDGEEQMGGSSGHHYIKPSPRPNVEESGVVAARAVVEGAVDGAARAHQGNERVTLPKCV